MDDYIPREAAKMAVVEALGKGHSPFNAIVMLPAADVAPVVRGKWIPVTNGRGGNECNQCHAYAPSHQCGVEYKSNYCPNCGARMDGDGDV